MKTIRIASAAVIGLGLLLSVGVMMAAATGPVGVSPFTAPYLDNQPHTIDGNGSLLLIQGSGVSLGLQVAPTETPTAEPTANTTAVPTANPTLTPYPTATLAANATAVPTTAPTAVPTTGLAPTVAPTANPTPVILANLDDPNRATAIDGNVHILAANSAVWYVFDYGLSDNGDRPVRTLTLVGANNSGVRFEVWTPDNLNDWWEKKPIGQGTANMVECNNSDQSGQTQCQSNDLTWSGAFVAGSPIYVRVVNDNVHPTPFQLTLQ